MSRVEKISNRLPRFYKHWKEDSLIFTLLKGVGKQLDEADERITDLMKTRWVDTAEGEALEKLGALVSAKRLPEEDDDRFGQRLKRAANEYKGGGTVSAILETVRTLVGSKEGDVEFIENPRVESTETFEVKAGDSWTLGSHSVTDEAPVGLSLTVEGEGSVENPQVTNVETGEFIGLKGQLNSGEQLIVKDDKAYVGENDVTEKVTATKAPTLLRNESNWRYSEAILERIAVFDTAKFDEHTFAVEVPTVAIRFDWLRSQPATFLIGIKAKALRESGVTQSYLEAVVDSMKASGVKATIEVSGR